VCFLLFVVLTFILFDKIILLISTFPMSFRIEYIFIHFAVINNCNTELGKHVEAVIGVNLDTLSTRTSLIFFFS
jgi:hypothetical protein